MDIVYERPPLPYPVALQAYQDGTKDSPAGN